MKVKSTSFHSAVSAFIAILIGAFLFFEFALPGLREGTDNAMFLGDSFFYRSRAVAANSMQEIATTGGVGLGSNVWAMVTIGKLAESLSEDYLDHIVFMLNLLIFMASLRNLQLIFRYFNATDQFSRFLFIFFLNPLLLGSLTVLNKEIWGIFFMTSFLRHTLEKNKIRYFYMVFFSFFIRDLYCFIGIFFYLMNRFKMKKRYYLIALSLIGPLITQYKIAPLLAAQNDLSLGFTLLLVKIQTYPFGYLITFPFRLIINMTDALIGLRAFDSTEVIRFDFIAMIMISCAIFCSTMAIIIRKKLNGIPMEPTVFNFVAAFTFLVCFSPVVQHRYFFPIWPILLMLAMLKAPDKQQQAIPSPLVALSTP